MARGLAPGERNRTRRFSPAAVEDEIGGRIDVSVCDPPENRDVTPPRLRIVCVEVSVPAVKPRLRACIASLRESRADRAVKTIYRGYRHRIAATNAGRWLHRVGALAERGAVPAPARRPFWMLTVRVPTPM